MTVHGSLQCPYYVHEALKRALALDDGRARGHPGRDRRRLRRQGGVPLDHRPPRGAAGAQGGPAGAHDLRPPRGHRRDDQAPPGDRPPPDRRHARRPARGPGHRGRHGRRRLLHAHAGRAVARHAPRRRPVRVPERAHPSPGDGAPTRRPTAPSAASARRRSSSRPRSRSTASPRRSGISPARDPPAQRATGPAARRRPARSCARASPREEVLERAAEAAEFERVRERTAPRAPAGRRGAAGRCARRARRGIGLALAWHGAGFTGSGEVKLALGRQPRADRRRARSGS